MTQKFIDTFDGMLSELNKNFGIKSSIAFEQDAFINRCNSFLQEFVKQFAENPKDRQLFTTICFQLGFNGEEIIREYNSRSHSTHEYVPDITTAFKKDFFITLKIVVLIRNFFSQNSELTNVFDASITDILSLSNSVLGINYRQGMFFPKGEEILDNDLIGHSLSTLSAFPNEDKDLRKALEYYYEGSKYGVIEYCYRCVEGIGRNILKNNKTLIDNKADLIKSIGLSDHWKKILANYIEYGNEYGRHASEKRHEFKEVEVEAYLYTTCVLVRLITKTKN
jgi:hypothetical protein